MSRKSKKLVEVDFSTLCGHTPPVNTPPVIKSGPQHLTVKELADHAPGVQLVGQRGAVVA